MSLTEERLQWALQQYDMACVPAAPATIGRLGERTLHAVLKSCYEPDIAFHEQPVGEFVADILHPGGIVEVQTGSFYPLRRKMPAFLRLYPVKIVHPLSVRKRVWWVDPETGQLTGGRKSPRPQRPVDVLPQLLWVLDWFAPQTGAEPPQEKLPAKEGQETAQKDFFPLTVELALLSMQEYRLLDGYARQGKKGAHRCNRLPEQLIGTVTLQTPADVAALLPPLPESFTAAQLNKALRFTRLSANAAKKVLLTLGILLPTGEKQGRAALFTLAERYRKQSEKS